MDLSNYEIKAITGLPLVGATVELFTATTTQPNPGVALASMYTDTNGAWAFTGLADGLYDVKVTAPGSSYVKWYKGMVKVGVQQLTSGDIYYEPGQVHPPLTVNGNYTEWQRIETGIQTATTTFSAITSFAADRMYTLPVGASVTVQLSAVVPDTKSLLSCLITGAASVTTVDHGQRIRSAFRVRYKNYVVFRAYIFNGSGAAFIPLLRFDTPAVADDWTTPTNRSSQSLQSCANNAWTLVSAIVDVSAFTNIDNGLACYIRIPSGSLTAGKSIKISQFDLRPGVVLRAYIPPDPDETKVRALAYYRKSYDRGTPLQTNTQVGLVGIASYASGGTNWEFFIPFSTPMWKAPSARTWGKAGVASQFWIGSPTFTDNNSSAVTLLSVNGITVVNNTTAAEQVFMHYDAVAELT